jgi:hypothetical protein
MSSALPSMTHHSTIPSDRPMYIFLSYPSTQLISVFGPSSATAVTLEGELVATEVALRPAAAATEAADNSRDPLGGGGEDGPAVSRWPSSRAYLLQRNRAGPCDSTSPREEAGSGTPGPLSVLSSCWNHALCMLAILDELASR